MTLVRIYSIALFYNIHSFPGYLQQCLAVSGLVRMKVYIYRDN